MSESSIFITARDVFAKNSAMTEVMNLLPKGCVISVRLENRLECILSLKNDIATLEDGPANGTADFELTLFSEGIRRLSARPFTDLTTLLVELSAQVATGNARLEPLRSMRELQKRGYLNSLARLAERLGNDKLAAPAHLILKMLAHRFNFAQSLLIAPTELFLKKLRKIIQK